MRKEAELSSQRLPTALERAMERVKSLERASDHLPTALERALERATSLEDNSEKDTVSDQAPKGTKPTVSLDFIEALLAVGLENVQVPELKKLISDARRSGRSLEGWGIPMGVIMKREELFPYLNSKKLH